MTRIERLKELLSEHYRGGRVVLRAEDSLDMFDLIIDELESLTNSIEQLKAEASRK